MSKKTVLIAGLGTIGRAVALMAPKEYKLVLHDINRERTDIVFRELLCSRRSSDVQVVSKGVPLSDCLTDPQCPVDAIVSAVPHHAISSIAEIALKHNVNYLDMTEDVGETTTLKQYLPRQRTATNALFVPNNGVAPGLVSLLAKEAMRQLVKKADIVKWENLTLRVGALPQHTGCHRLQYGSSWSLAGCVNQYIKPCLRLHNGKIEVIPPLTEYGRIRIGGQEYEEFATSGGVGSLCDSLCGIVPNVIYKTLRYPGHHQYMSFLLHDMKFRDHPQQLVQLLQQSLPMVSQDHVVVHVTAQGSNKAGQSHELVISKTIIPTVVDGIPVSAIEVATASSTLAVLELVLSGWKNQRQTSYLKVEDIPYKVFQGTLAATRFL